MIGFKTKSSTYLLNESRKTVRSRINNFPFGFSRERRSGNIQKLLQKRFNTEILSARTYKERKDEILGI